VVRPAPALADNEYDDEEEDEAKVEEEDSEADEAGVTATGVSPRCVRAKVAPAARRRSK
jgi:hypothetical protein